MNDKFYAYFWLPFLAVLLFILLAVHGTRVKIITFIGIVVYISIPIIMSLISDKRRAKEYEEYRRKYIFEIECDFEEFGIHKFEWNKETNEFSLFKGEFPSIAANKVTNFIVKDYNENISLILNCLRYIYSNKKTICEMCCDCVEETYKAEDITEIDNTAITHDYIMERIFLDTIIMTIQGNSVSAVVMGGVDIDIEEHISEHGLNINIFQDGRIELE